MINNENSAFVILENGKILKGTSIGKKGRTIGEIVFTTTMTGYQETLTDPSYFGQIVIQTFPLIGNYGVNSFDSESDKSYVNGYIVREICDSPSNFRSEDTLDSFLKKQNIIGISDIDTRYLTQFVRNNSPLNAMITTELTENTNIDKLISEIKSFKIENAVKSVSTLKAQTFHPEKSEYHVVLLDYGYKSNIKNELVKRNCSVTVVPHNTICETIKSLNPDGIMLSNGPGDPEDNIEEIENLKQMMKLNIPIFGICLGHQLMALANNAKTTKLKYGHRGANQPVIDINLNKIFITTQNHGYAVMEESLDQNIAVVSHKNVNDKSCEGIIYKNCNAFTVQFHPEACSGPQDTSYLFDNFIKKMKENVKYGD